MIDSMLDAWTTAMWRACWQGGLVVLVVWTICQLLPSMPARFQCWLWRLAILKFMVVLVVPWFFNVPLLPARPVPERMAAEITTVARAFPTHVNQVPTLPQAMAPARAMPLPSLPEVLFAA